VVSISAMSVQGVEDIKRRLEQVKVVAVTCLGISSPLLANTRFDVCIMDEAGQTTLPVCFFFLLCIISKVKLNYTILWISFHIFFFDYCISLSYHDLISIDNG